MGVPKYKPSKSRKRLRRSHDAISAAGFVRCGNCGLRVEPHRICGNCGHYKSKKKSEGKTRLVVNPQAGSEG